MKNRLVQDLLPYLLGFAGVASAPGLFAQAFPSKPIRVVVPFAAGSVLDLTARLVGEKMSAAFEQPVLVDNRPGAGGRVGAERVARSAPDGYTVLLTHAGAHVGNVHLIKDQVLDPVKDFTPISAVISTVDAVLVHPAVPVNSIAELIEYAKRNPGKLAYGSNGMGSYFHVTGELIKQAANINMLHVPLQGASEQMNAVVGGHIQVAFIAVSAARAQAVAGKVKLIAMVGARYPGLPRVPALSEVLPGYQPLPSWVGYLGPAGMPQAVVERLNAEIVKGLNQPDVRAKLDERGLIILGNSPGEFAGLVQTGLAAYGKAVKAANVQPQ